MGVGSSDIIALFFLPAVSPVLSIFFCLLPLFFYALPFIGFFLILESYSVYHGSGIRDHRVAEKSVIAQPRLVEAISLRKSSLRHTQDSRVPILSGLPSGFATGGKWRLDPFVTTFLVFLMSINFLLLTVFCSTLGGRAPPLRFFYERLFGFVRVANPALSWVFYCRTFPFPVIPTKAGRLWRASSKTQVKFDDLFDRGGHKFNPLYFKYNSFTFGNQDEEDKELLEGRENNGDFWRVL